VAYALIAQADGVISFHTNRFLVGSVLPTDEVGQFLKAGLSSGKRVNLQTGMAAYQFDYMLHNPEGKPGLLRLVLHTTPADSDTIQSEKSMVDGACRVAPSLDYGRNPKSRAGTFSPSSERVREG